MYMKTTNPGSECMGCLVGQLLVCLGAAGEGREGERERGRERENKLNTLQHVKLL